MTIYFDGGQRELQRRATVDPGARRGERAHRPDPVGDAAAEYEPTFEATLSYAPPPLAGRPARRIHYDALGRPVRTVDYSGGVCTVQIRPLEIVTTDAVGGVKAERLDVANRCVECRETGPGGAVARTTFEHTALGHLAAYGDDLGEVARHTLDARGEKLVIRHREAGTRRLVVDAQRRVVAVTNARGQTIEAAFDAADRIAELRVDGAASETYGYDDAPAGAVGRLREVRYPGGSQRMAYDVRGRLVRQEWSVDGHAQPYAIERTYNAQGLETGVTYPDGSVVERESHGERDDAPDRRVHRRGRLRRTHAARQGRVRQRRDDDDDLHDRPGTRGDAAHDPRRRRGAGRPGVLVRRPPAAAADR